MWIANCSLAMLLSPRLLLPALPAACRPATPPARARRSPCVGLSPKPAPMRLSMARRLPRAPLRALVLLAVSWAAGGCYWRWYVWCEFRVWTGVLRLGVGAYVVVCAHLTHLSVHLQGVTQLPQCPPTPHASRQSLQYISRSKIHLLSISGKLDRPPRQASRGCVEGCCLHFSCSAPARRISQIAHLKTSLQRFRGGRLGSPVMAHVVRSH